MKIRAYDRFDFNFTCAIYEQVEYVDSNGTIYFQNGDEAKIDTEFEDWEELGNGTND